MGVNLKAKSKELKYNNYQMLTIGRFEALKEFSDTVAKSENLKHFFSVYRGSWSAEDTKTIAELLNKITLRQVAAFKKASRDEAIKAPITTCTHCEGVGITKLDSFGNPQYVNFCAKCSGLGVTRKTFDIGEYIDLLSIKHLAEFLAKSGGVSVS